MEDTKMSKVSNWGSEAVKYQQAADRLNRADTGTVMLGAGDARQGEQVLDSFVPTDRDYSRAERADQQKQLHEMMKTIRAERNQRPAL